MSEIFKRTILLVALLADVLTIAGYFSGSELNSTVGNLASVSGWKQVSDFAISPLGVLSAFLTYIVLVMFVKIYGNQLGMVDLDSGMVFAGPLMLIMIVYVMGALFIGNLGL